MATNTYPSVGNAPTNAKLKHLPHADNKGLITSRSCRPVDYIAVPSSYRKKNNV